jgi:hypothetical protein
VAETVCQKCYGSGALETEKTHLGIPIVKPCTCLLAKDLIRNLNRGWAGLSTAPKIESSPLSGHVGDFLYLTASDEALRAHLRHVALRMGPWWGFKVVSDSDLMVAWLSTASLAGKEILDPDAATVSSEKATLVDLTEPPELLIVRLGVKAARNSAMSEVFLEAILHRIHIRKPMWVVDQPTRKLDALHMCFSDEVVRALSEWDRLVLTPGPASPGLSLEMLSGGPSSVVSSPHQGLSPSAGVIEGTRRIAVPTPKEPKKPKFFSKGDR